jgi:hypothetical protein
MSAPWWFLAGWICASAFIAAGLAVGYWLTRRPFDFVDTADCIAALSNGEHA